MNLSKAFGTVNHKILLAKLKFYGFHENFIKLIRSYLHKRRIRVIVNNTLSLSQIIDDDLGVPQGSVLGPLLFIVYFNDFNFLTTLSLNFLYADDTTMSCYGRDMNLIIHNMERDLILIEEWLNNNRLLINVKKTQAMHFSASAKYKNFALNNNDPDVDISKHKHIMFKDKKITFVKNFRLLGFIIDNQLRFEDQVKSICKKVNSITGLLCKSSYLFTDKIKPSLFKLFIMNRFEYCGAAILHLPNRKCLDRLEKSFSNSISRFLSIFITFNINYFQDIDSFSILKKKFNIFPLKYRLFFHFCTFLFNLCKSNNIFYKNNFIRNSRNTRAVFMENQFKTDFGKFSFTTIATKILNKFLTTHLDLGSSTTFKNFLRLDLNLFNLYEGSKGIWTWS